MKKIFVTVFIFVTIMVSAMYRTPEAGRVYYWMYSPSLLSIGMGLGGSSNPSGMVINPASNAFAQNIKIEVNYGLAPGIFSYQQPISGEFKDGGDFFWPFAVNGGIVVPSKFGNFSGYLSYMNMSNEGFDVANNNDMGIGKVGSVYFGFSKDYSDEFSFGFSGNLKFSYNPVIDNEEDFFDVGGALSFALIFRPEWFAPMSEKFPNWGLQDFEFSVLLKELGKPLINFAGKGGETLGWFAEPFDPGVSLNFNLYNNGATYWKILTDLHFPFFQNVVFALGTEIQIHKFVVLRGSYTFDLEGVLEYTGAIDRYEYMYQIFNFAGGISFKFRSDLLKKSSKEEMLENRHKVWEFSVDLGVKPYHNGLIFQAGATIQIGTKDTAPPEIDYIQKNTYASPNLDGVQDNIEIELDINDERYVKYWKMEVYDDNDQIVRLIESKEERKESLKFKDVVKKYFQPKRGVPIPDVIYWDCRDDNGNIVEDGQYTFKFFATDDNDNLNEEGSALGSVVIDTEEPEIEIKTLDNKIFSPNDDGMQDELIIDIEIIRNEASSIIIPDNSFYKDNYNHVEEIFIMDDSFIDENIDNVKEIELPSLIKNEVKDEKVQIWNVDIVDSNGEVVKSYEFDKKGSHKIAWDGKDTDGNKMPDGVYGVKLYSVDLAGNYWEEKVSNIILDTTPTPIEIMIDQGIFSPNGNGIKDEVNFEFDIPVKKGIVSWSLDIIDSKDKSVRKFEGQNMPPANLTWNGMNNSNKVVSEGAYRGQLNVIYQNGNRPQGTTPEFIVDLTPPSANIKLSTDIFSPDGDGVKDEVIVKQSASTEEIWEGIIFDAGNKEVKRYIWRSEPPKEVAWDGRSNSGELLPDGKYAYQLKGRDYAGNLFESEKMDVKIFTEETPVFISYKEGSFSPNGDKIKDIQEFNIRANITEGNSVSQWTVEVINDKDQVVYSYQKDGSLESKVLWDGKNNSGKTLGDGMYKGRITADFASGIVSKSLTPMFKLDNTPPEIEVMAQSEIISPNNDGFLDELIVLQKGSEEKQWATNITDSSGVIWSSYNSGKPVSKLVWDGKDKNGNIVKNGEYTYTISSTDDAGNTASAEIENFEVKNIHTSAFLTLRDNKISPNNDKLFDTLGIKTIVNYQEDIKAYELDIINEQSESVKKIQGKGSIPELFEWDGYKSDGKVAADGVYRARLKIKYRFGNEPEAVSGKFKLDTEAPDIKLAMIPEYFSPDNDNVDDELKIRVDASDLTGIKDWNIRIMTPNGKKEFMRYDGTGHPTNQITWNGVGKDGELVESAEDYPVWIYAEDMAGNVLDKQLDPILVDILVEKLDDGRLRIKISNIEFKPESSDMTDSPKNDRIIELIARALNKYRRYDITLEGHANRFKEGLNEAYAKDLSYRRAVTIKNKLNAKGVAAQRMTPIGRGFDDPLFPLTPDVDREDLAKNRRVEFYLNRK